MESPLPIVGQEFFFEGTCLPSCSLATDIHVTIYTYQLLIIIHSHTSWRTDKKITSYSERKKYKSWPQNILPLEMFRTFPHDLQANI
jgi:hypothetical protein